MTINTFAISGIVLTCTCLILIFIILLGKKSKLHRLWIACNISLGLWGFSSILIALTKQYQESLFWWKIGSVGIISLPPFFLHLALVLCNVEKKKILLLTYTQGFIFIILNFTNLLIPDLQFVFNSFYYPKITGFIYPIMYFLWVLIVAYGSYTILIAYRNAQGLKRRQLLYFFVGTTIGFVGGIVNFFPVFGIRIYPLSNFSGPLYIGIATYAILKYRLMDIRVALTRAGIFVIVYTLVLGIPLGLTGWGKYWLQGLFGSNWYWASLILAIILATLGPFIYIYIDRRAEERLLKEQRRYQNTLKQASVGMTRIRNLRKLLDLITHIVTKTVKIAYAGIYLYNQETNEFVLQVMRDKGRMPVLKLAPDNPLLSYITANRQPLVYEELKRLTEDTTDATYRLLEENMRLLTASVIIPNFLKDRFLGFFVLGEKTSGQVYTPDDLNVFQILASQAALAIENARFFEETKQMQEQLAQAEKMATIGTMADGLSHQINNRFYALSLIAADTIDTIKTTDTSNCSPEVKEAFSQIAYALERVKANVIQGGEVVKGILKYTRKGEEGFEALSLDQILDSTLDMVQYKVKLSEIDIIRNYPKDHPKIKGNLVQLQENFFNFIDNAYDAIVERRILLKEPGYKGRITISAFPQDGHLEIVIEDNGMGIKDEVKKRLFTPFFTTKVSSRQATGLGLYVIKRIIEEFHKGKIWFESEYGQGTRFFLQLPIARE